MVPMPTLFWAIKTPMTDVKNSGAEPPAAINVAPLNECNRKNINDRYVISI